jgi:hypothetical protein
MKSIQNTGLFYLCQNIFLPVIYIQKEIDALKLGLLSINSLTDHSPLLHHNSRDIIIFVIGIVYSYCNVCTSYHYIDYLYLDYYG